MKQKVKKMFFIVILIVFVKGSISSPLDLFTNSFLSVETKDPIEATIQTTQVPQTKSAFEWQSQADNIYNVKYLRNEQNKFYNASKIERSMIDREEKEKTGRPPLRNEPDVHDSNSIGFEKNYYYEDNENKDDFEDVNIFNGSYDKISNNKEFEMEGSGFGNDFVGIKGRNLEIEGSGDEIGDEKESVKEKPKDLNRRKGKHGFAEIIIEKFDVNDSKRNEEENGNKTVEILNLKLFSQNNDSKGDTQENSKIEEEIIILIKNETENETLFESTSNILTDNFNKEIILESTTTKLENGYQITPLTEIITLKPITEDEWLKIINSSPNELVNKPDDVLEFLGLDIKTVSPIKTNIIDIDPFKELTTSSENKNVSILTEKLVGNGKFNSENITFIENNEKITITTEKIESEKIESKKIGSKKIESANIVSVEDDSNENLQEDLKKHSPNLDDYLLKLWPDLKQNEKMALKTLTKNVKLETLAHYDLKYLLKNIETDQKGDGVTETYDHTFLKSKEFDENVEICFMGMIGYQFILITENNELESPKYLDQFNKICVNSYEPILIIQQESSYLELKFKILHDVITLQSIHVNVNGKDEIDNIFKENLNEFNALIGGNIKIDELKLGDFNKNEEGLSLVLFDVDLTTEMYLNGRLMADNLDDEEEGTTTLIISASVGVFSVSFLVIIVLIYQFCLKNKSRKMIYILTHR
ncbi:uncharacterized protein [Onthophagus taurus]|uniref:uncharacterized protein n=1 Tax=Onthophagus taurus TaxID=166361 RepID=UPI0039BEB3E1